MKRGATKISDSDIYSENQAVSGSVADGEYEEIASLDDPGEGDPLAAAVRRAQPGGRGRRGGICGQSGSR